MKSLNGIKNFINLNKLIFNLKKTPKTNKVILVEFNKWACNHIAFSNCILSLKKNLNYKVIAFPENGFQHFIYRQKIFNKIKFFFGKVFGLKNFGIYKSFSTEDFIKIENSSFIIKKSEPIYRKLKDKIKKKSDILKIKINNILVGDLIYDSFLKEYNRETIDINDLQFDYFLKKSIQYFLFWYYEIDKRNTQVVLSSQSVYLSSIPTRIGLYKNCTCLVANPERLYKLSKKNIYSDKEFNLFKSIKKKINKKLLKRGLKIAKKRLELRFKGNAGVDLSYLSKTAYGKFQANKLLRKNKNLKILISPHSFSDAPHQLGNHLFADYFDWLDFICRNADKEKYDWYIKCHPNFNEYFDNTIQIVKNFTYKYKFIKYLEPNVSHNQLIKEGIKAVFTCHGTIGSEYPYFNIPVVNASKSNPHINYKFNFHPQNITELGDTIKNIDKKKLRINKKDVIENYFFKNIYFSNKWIFENFESLIKFCGGYKKIYDKKSYEYWIKNWSIKKQEKITKAIDDFINSDDYMMTFKNYKISLKKYLDENFL